MVNEKIRLILDTNWYISATINKRSRRTVYKLLTNEEFTIIFSDEILREYWQVISRDKFRKIVTAEQIQRFIKLVLAKLEHIELRSAIKGSRDPKDNFLLSLSFDTGADYLITGDVDLLILKSIGLTKIITFADLCNIFPAIDPK